ncbi:MAG: hypothetical protein RR573_08845 [Oscillospiraceae bacterium]
MDFDEQEQDDEQEQKRQQKPKVARSPEDDEGTMEYAERPAFVAVDKQESVFDRGSLNRQYGINTQPSVFESTWKESTNTEEQNNI